MSKGSTPRPFSVSQQEYNTRWDAIFGREDTTESEVVESSDQKDNALSILDSGQSTVRIV